ncbi:MAG: aminoacyl-tRNA hydrolase [Ignavibacteriaceae bacterium]
MRIILGIGNPGRRYSFNRHNVGFMFLDYIAVKESLSFLPSKGDFYFAEGKINNFEFNLIKPSTYVNDSGKAAFQALQLYNSDVEDLLVFVDDLNLNFPEIRVRASGGDGGHNGIASIIYHLNSDKFPRIRIGISNHEKNSYVDFVLSDFSKDEKNSLTNIFDDCMTLTTGFIEGGIKKMMDINSTLKDSSYNKEKGSREKL